MESWEWSSQASLKWWYLSETSKMKSWQSREKSFLDGGKCSPREKWDWHNWGSKQSCCDSSIWTEVVYVGREKIIEHLVGHDKGFRCNS